MVKREACWTELFRNPASSFCLCPIISSEGEYLNRLPDHLRIKIGIFSYVHALKGIKGPWATSGMPFLASKSSHTTMYLRKLEVGKKKNYQNNTDTLWSMYKTLMFREVMLRNALLFNFKYRPGLAYVGILHPESSFLPPPNDL